MMNETELTVDEISKLPLMQSLFWFRFEDGQYAAPVDECGNSQGPGQTYVRLHKYRAIKYTRCGVRLDNGRFVNRSSTKRFACPSIKEALESFKRRKELQIFYLQSRITRVKDALTLLEIGMIEGLSK